MNSYVTATIILGEISLVLLVVLGILSFMTLRKKMRIKNGLNKLIEKLKANQEDHANKLKTILKDSYHLEESLVDETSNKIVQQENMLYKNLIHIYSKGEQEHIEKIDEKVAELISIYQNLTPKPAAATQDSEVTETVEAGQDPKIPSLFRLIGPFTIH